jgi:glycosyltransferase involved in cell wall biosynthesis
MEFTKKYNLIIVGKLDYPFGNAPSNRVHSYAKGLFEEGFQIVVICTNPPFNEPTDFPTSGTFENIDYYYPTGLVKKKNDFLRKLWTFYSPFITVYNIHKIRKNSQKLTLYEYSTSFQQEFVYWAYCRIFGIPILREAGEIPYYKHFKKNFSLTLKLLFFNKLRISLYDGVVVISDLLENYYLKYKRYRTRILKIPILVDLERFSKDKIMEEHRSLRNSVVYVGDMQEEKDGLVYLIKAFKILLEVAPDFNLILIGPTKKAKMDVLLDLIEKLNLQEKIQFTGEQSREIVASLLLSASILVLSRPQTRQTDAGFPTKLGEYLATGKPVVVTRVGEIPLFLEDGKNAYLAEPENHLEFAEKLKAVALNPVLSVKIGEAGKILAEKEFNYKTHGPRLYKFILTFHAQE